MTTKVVIHQAGVDELLRTSIRFTEDFTKKCEAEAKQFVPVDTGNLRESIKTVKVEETKYAYGSDEDYAPFIEFGTRNQEPQPYLRPAFWKAKAENQ